MAMMNLRDLYVDQLRDLYSAEQQILVALPKMIAAATDPKLRRKFEKHQEETREQADPRGRGRQDLPHPSPYTGAA